MRPIASLRALFLGATLLALFGMPAPAAKAQYFGNNAFQAPIVGWRGLATTANWADDKWFSTDQLQLGFGYLRALSGYKLWLVSQSVVGFGYARESLMPLTQVIVSLNLATGLRYNFLERRVRPFVTGLVEYLQFFNDGGRYRAFAGLGFGPGIEWIFGNDMSVQLETGAQAMIDFYNPARYSWTARLSYLIYF